MANDALISDLIDMLFEAKKMVNYLPTLPNNLRKSHLQVMQVIAKLSAETSEVRVTDISKELKISSPNITKLVNELTESQMVNKIPSVKDKRIVQVSLTHKGEVTFNQYVQTYHKYLDELIEKIGVKRCEEMITTMREISCEMKDASNKFKEELM